MKTDFIDDIKRSDYESIQRRIGKIVGFAAAAGRLGGLRGDFDAQHDLAQDLFLRLWKGKTFDYFVAEEYSDHHVFNFLMSVKLPEILSIRYNRSHPENNAINKKVREILLADPVFLENAAVPGKKSTWRLTPDLDFKAVDDAAASADAADAENNLGFEQIERAVALDVARRSERQSNQKVISTGDLKTLLIEVLTVAGARRYCCTLAECRKLVKSRLLPLDGETIEMPRKFSGGSGGDSDEETERDFADRSAASPIDALIAGEADGRRIRRIEYFLSDIRHSFGVWSDAGARRKMLDMIWRNFLSQGKYPLLDCAHALNVPLGKIKEWKKNFRRQLAELLLVEDSPEAEIRMLELLTRRVYEKLFYSTIYARKWRAAHWEDWRAYQKEYQSRWVPLHRSRLRVYWRRYRAKNITSVRAAQRDAYRARHNVTPDRYQAKLTSEIVVRLRGEYLNGESIGVLAAREKVSDKTVYDAVSGKTWKNLPLPDYRTRKKPNRGRHVKAGYPIKVPLAGKTV